MLAEKSELQKRRMTRGKKKKNTCAKKEQFKLFFVFSLRGINYEKLKLTKNMRLFLFILNIFILFLFFRQTLLYKKVRKRTVKNS